MAINLNHQLDTIGTSSNTIKIENTGNLILPKGNTSQRFPSTGINADASIRYNTDTCNIEYFTKNSWFNVPQYLDDLVDVNVVQPVDGQNRFVGYDPNTCTFNLSNSIYDLTVENNTLICGDLTVCGTTTSIQTIEVQIKDKNITLADGATNLTEVDGAGITVDYADASLIYCSTTDTWNLNKNLNVCCIFGQVSDISNFTTTDLPEGINLYYTDTRSRSSIGVCDLTGSSVLTYDPVTGIITYNGTDGTAGTPTDGTWLDGAFLGFEDSDLVVDILDELNESLENVRRNTFVRSVIFTGNPLSGGEGTTVTLIINAEGDANRYDIDWGDGSQTTGTADDTPSHVYTSNANSPYTVTVRAYNNGSIPGTAGSEASHTEVDYIIIYTADPNAAFALYRNSTGGSELLGNNLYVIEGDSLWMQNNTQNTLMADVTYTLDWGDGSSISNIVSDNVNGGVSGGRLQHTWAPGTATGNGVDTVTLTLVSHTTADPAVIPNNTTLPLKVYDPNIGPPDGLSTKIINGPSSVGTSPYLTSGYTNNNNSNTASGSSVTRVLNSGIVNSSTIGTFAYNADSGFLSAKVNGVDDGLVNLTSADNSGTYTSLVVTEESDYNLLSTSGSSISFNNSIYHPGLFKGFKANVTKNAATLPLGTNDYQLSHSTTGDTNKVEFVVDDLINTPTTSSGTFSENVGNYRYISGIPYYKSGSSLTLSGVTIDDFIGQVYANISDVFTVSSGVNLEGTSQSGIDTQNFTYNQINGSVSFLTAGIPNANTGNGTPYTIGNVTVDITNNNVRTIDSLKYLTANINGAGSWYNNTKNIAVHTANQSGISEIGIEVSNSLGSTFTDDGIRIFDFSGSTINNPSFVNNINYYTNNTYSENLDPGVQGTKEATVRLGVLEHNVTDYSVNYLPVGPNRSGDTGTQYFTFAFRRTVVANFDINIVSNTGVAGLWIAAPNTAIDNTSTINGWLDCGIQYNGAGVPGADVGAGGNGSNGCAVTGADIIQPNTNLNSSYRMTLGTENLTNAFGNVALVRIALTAGQRITSLSIS